ncbi:FecCD family ABC transporter permease [Streptococcus oralis]|uniref:FecCD family ABC transporter permease n=1 Tax=Streptococcus oralis TaxID=1303 RepID=UPI002284AAC6|nr:iron ABC transporter permease [Streptococcus oralis]MCY7078600.1 iron ABC transporter permease [Streptococcus oralis]
MLSKFSGSRQDLQFVLFLVILLSVLGISLFLAVSMGSVAIDLGDTYRIILSRLGFPLEIGEVSKSTLAIVWNMRFPRVLLGLIVGAGLSMCGSVMQSTVNNPIAEPYVLGISAGATLGATLSIILGLKLVISLGAILATIAVLIIASMQGRMTTSSLILSGTVVNALFLAFSNFIISVGANADSVMTIKFWTMGSLAGTTWSDLVLPTIVVGMAFLFFSTQYRVFNAMMMGDEAALTLGIPLSFYWYLYVTMVAVLTAVLVATCGIIGFVGLITPHLARGLVGTNYRRLFPVATILGALFVVWADVLSRIIIPNAELPIGIFTALVGAPFFIYIVGGRRREVRA